MTMANHVSYTLVPTLDQTVVGSGLKGTIKVTITHAGANETKEFNVWSEDRTCNILGD